MKNVRLKRFVLLGIVLRMSYGKEQTFNLIPRFYDGNLKIDFCTILTCVRKCWSKDILLRGKYKKKKNPKKIVKQKNSKKYM